MDKTDERVNVQANPMKHPRVVVIGVDAAWKWSNGSGVAVVSSDGNSWRLDRVAASYDEFFQSSVLGVPTSPMELPKRLVEAAKAITGGTVEVVAMDLPLSRSPITGRRCADNTVNRYYAARGASTHSMVNKDAIQLSADITEAFSSLTIPLVTRDFARPALIEVYPHVALLELTKSNYRLEYKVGKIRRYWGDLSPQARREKLIGVWEEIVSALSKKISGLDRQLLLPMNEDKIKNFKSFEDKLDAVVCAYVAIEFLNKAATPYGDHDAAIWGPSPHC